MPLWIPYIVSTSTATAICHCHHHLLGHSIASMVGIPHTTCFNSNWDSSILEERKRSCFIGHWHWFPVDASSVPPRTLFKHSLQYSIELYLLRGIVMIRGTVPAFYDCFWEAFGIDRSCRFEESTVLVKTAKQLDPVYVLFIASSYHTSDGR
jgi:hypothetical protein